jgi:hypothetical protein
MKSVNNLLDEYKFLRATPLHDRLLSAQRADYAPAAVDPRHDRVGTSQEKLP